MYLSIKYSHIILVITSVLLFELRFFIKTFRQKPLSLKITPHVIDTFLLISGILLVFLLGLNPLNSPWLLFKLIALLAYIVFGMIAMKSSGTKSTLSFILATLCVVYMIMTAISKNPLFFT